jgi:hypothetical protein
VSAGVAEPCPYSQGQPGRQAVRGLWAPSWRRALGCQQHGHAPRTAAAVIVDLQRIDRGAAHRQHETGRQARSPLLPREGVPDALLPAAKPHSGGRYAPDRIRLR